jgi:hypothetical protein
MSTLQADVKKYINKLSKRSLRDSAMQPVSDGSHRYLISIAEDWGKDEVIAEVDRQLGK